MATIKICDRIGCMNRVEPGNWSVSKSPYLNPLLYDSRIYDVCDTCMFEVFGVSE